MTTQGYFLGVDVGSLSCDGALLDDNQNIVASLVLPTGVSGSMTAEKMRRQLLVMAGIDERDVLSTVSTGYGRERVSYATKAVTEITCHARGAHFHFPSSTVVIDIGGQDSKAIRIDNRGKVLDFIMNDRCAAGTGRFLEVMAHALEIELMDMGRLSLTASRSCQISSICTVFAESEVVSLLAQGTAVDEIIRGLHDAVAHRTVSLMQRIKPQTSDFVTISGGVALNGGVVHALQQLLKATLFIPSQPQIIGAVGAALIARDYFRKGIDQTREIS